MYGEGEKTLEEIIENVKYNRSIPGCRYRKNGQTLDGGYRPQIRDLDALPFPDYSSFQFERYIFSSHIPVLFTRGCTWNCSFCSKKMNWQSFSSRTPENIFSEITARLRDYPFISSFYVCDHSMNANIPLLRRLCSLLIERGVKKEFFGYGQILKPMLDDSFLNTLKQAGFKNWGIGMQSGSDRILKSMKRPYTTAMAEQVFKKMHAHGLRVYTDLIAGYPTETEEDFQATLGFISRIKQYVENITIQPTCSVGNNDLKDNPERYGLISIPGHSNWISRSNTPEQRSERYTRAMEHMRAIKLSSRLPNSDREHFNKTDTSS